MENFKPGDNKEKTEEQFEKEFKELHRELTKKIHPDLFHVNNGKADGGKWFEEANNLLRGINSLRDHGEYFEKKYDEKWEFRLKGLKQAEKDIDDFLKRVNDKSSTKTENKKPEEKKVDPEKEKVDPEKEKKEAREAKKEEILKNITEAISEIESWNQDQKIPQTEKEKWTIESVRKSMQEAKGDENLTYEVKTKGKKQREGIPADDLMEELGKISLDIKEKLKEKKYKEAVKNLSEKNAKIEKLLAFLEENSQNYFDLHPKMKDVDKQHWRTELEAWFIHQDHRKTGDTEKDYQLAMEAMKKRREIVLPKDVVREKKPDSPKNEKTEEKSDPEKETAEPKKEKNKERKQIEYQGEKKQIEYQGKNKEERKQNIEKLWQDVEKARKEYLEKDYSNNKVITRLKNFFGSFLNKSKEGAGFESDKELAEYRAYYDNALLEHKKAVLEDIKLGGASEKEILDIAKFYQIEANVNLADVHDEVKIEKHEGKFSGFIKEHSKELVERYKKMSLVKKIAIGAAFGLAGVGSIYIGGAAVGIVGSAIAARRAIMGAITGTTVALGFEARGKKKTAEKNQAEMKDLEVEMLGLSEEEKVKILEDFVNKNIQDEDRKIDKVKNKNLRHLAYGTLAGIGVILAPKIMRMFSETGTPGGSVPEQSGGQNVPVSELEGPERLGMTDEEIAEKLAAEEAEKTPEDTFETGSVVMEVQKGDSLWKIIDKQLEEKYENYSALDEGKKTHVIDSLKYKVAADSKLENIDELKIGQKINLEELFKEDKVESLLSKAEKLDEDQIKNILDNNQKLRDWVKANPGEKLTSEKTAEILKEASEGPERLGMTDEEITNASETSNIEEAPKVEEVEKAPEILEESKINDNSDVNKQASEGAESAREPEIQFEKSAREPEATLSEVAVEHNVNKVMPTQEIEIPGGKIILNSYGDGNSSVNLKAIVKPSAESADLLSKSADGRIDIKLTREGEEVYKGRFTNETQKKLFLKTTAERFAAVRHSLFQGLEQAKISGNQKAVDIIQHALDLKKQQCEKLYGNIFIK